MDFKGHFKGQNSDFRDPSEISSQLFSFSLCAADIESADVSRQSFSREIETEKAHGPKIQKR